MRFRIWLLGFSFCWTPVSLLAQSAMTEPPEFPSSVPGPSSAHPGTPCFPIAGGAITPGDVEWIQVTIPFGSSQTVVDVDITSTTGRSALLASVVGGGTQFNMADNNNPADGLCGLGASSSPVGSMFDSVGDVGPTRVGATINIGITGSGDSAFTGNHQQTFTYEVWVYVIRLDPDCVMDSECTETGACTVGRCNPNTGTCEYTPDHSLCDDGDYCNGRERCSATAGCLDGASPCPPGFACDEDGERCGDCVEDEDCDDGVFCNGTERCMAGFCEDGSQVPCDDGIDCTVDLCDGETNECVHAADDRLCDDGAYCNGVETCDPSEGCVAGVVPCEDGVDCTDDRCDEAADACSYAPNDALCGNGIYCDGIETCDAVLGCQAGPDPCDDQVDCTEDSCDEGNDTCKNRPVDTLCANGNFCDGAETCDLRMGCWPGSAPCDDHIECTLDSCDEGNDTCKNRPDNSRCDDGVDCTVDRCDTADGSCHHFPVDAECDDGKFCNGAETCDVVAGCLPGDQPCPMAVRCNERKDTCINCQSDAQCNDGRFCNGKEVCVQGACQAGSRPKCDDGVECTVDSCNAKTDRCEHAANHRSCDDGDYCNGKEVCHPKKDCQKGPKRCRKPSIMVGAN